MQSGGGVDAEEERGWLVRHPASVASTPPPLCKGYQLPPDGVRRCTAGGGWMQKKKGDGWCGIPRPWHPSLAATTPSIPMPRAARARMCVGGWGRGGGGEEASDNTTLFQKLLQVSLPGATSPPVRVRARKQYNNPRTPVILRPTLPVFWTGEGSCRWCAHKQSLNKSSELSCATPLSPNLPSAAGLCGTVTGMMLDVGSRALGIVFEKAR